MEFYNQKVCVVTGAASGIGRACALALASYGAKTVITDIRKDMLDETTELIKSAGGAVTRIFWMRLIATAYTNWPPMSKKPMAVPISC